MTFVVIKNFLKTPLREIGLRLIYLSVNRPHPKAKINPYFKTVLIESSIASIRNAKLDDIIKELFCARELIVKGKYFRLGVLSIL